MATRPFVRPEEASVPSLNGGCRAASLGPTPGQGKSEAEKNGQRIPFPAVKMSNGELNTLEKWSRVGRNQASSLFLPQHCFSESAT